MRIEDAKTAVAQGTCKQISFEYVPEVDRFLCFRGEVGAALLEVLQSQGYNGLEYFRYIAGKGVSLPEIERCLRAEPHELCCEITNECNLRCAVCIADAPADWPTHLSPSCFSDLLENIGTVDRITITGGEPTLNPDFPEILHLASRMSKAVVLSTNGLASERVREALDVCPNVILAVSLHGTAETHDHFTNCAGACSLARKTLSLGAGKGVPIQVHSTVTPTTLEDLAALFELLNDTPISEHRLNLVKPHGRGANREVSFEDVSRRIKSAPPHHKVVVKRVDQPFLFANCSGNLEIRHA